MQSFSAGQVIGRAAAIWMRSVVPFTIVAFVCFLPMFVFDALVGYGVVNLSPFQFTVVGTLLQTLLGMVSTGALTFGVISALRGDPATIGDSLTKGMRRFYGVLSTSISMSISVVIGLVLFVVPGLLIFTTIFVAVPASVIEERTSSEARQRSTELTKGQRPRIFGIVLLGFAINFGIGRLYGLVVPEPTRQLDFLLYNLGLAALAAFVAPFQAACSAVTYYELRRIKEGTDIEELAAVFD